MYICIYVYMYICIHVYMYICIYTPTRKAYPIRQDQRRKCTDTYTHTHHCFTRLRIRHVTNVNESCHTYHLVISHT